MLDCIFLFIKDLIIFCIYGSFNDAVRSIRAD